MFKRVWYTRIMCICEVHHKVCLILYIIIHVETVMNWCSPRVTISEHDQGILNFLEAHISTFLGYISLIKKQYVKAKLYFF